MKPYYQSGGITIYHGNMASLGHEHRMEFDTSFNVCVTDPPYGETSLEWDRRITGWPQVIPCMSIWCFGSFRMFMDMAEDGDWDGWNLAQEIVWEKHNGSSFHADRFKRVHELAAQFYKGEWAEIYKSPVTTPDATARAVRRKQRPPHTGHIEAGSYTSHDGGPRLMRSVIAVRSCHGVAEHPTQKPIGIIDPLLRYSCPIGGTVLDPFMGSGSILIAAKGLGLQAVGIEIEEKYCEIAAKRLSQDVLDFGERPFDLDAQPDGGVAK